MCLMVIRPSTVFSYTWILILFILLFRLLLAETSSKFKQSFKINLNTYTHGFASGAYSLFTLPSSPFITKLFFHPPKKAGGWNLSPFNVTSDTDD